MSDAEPARYWHGGAPGLVVGDEIVCRAELPNDSLDRQLFLSGDDPTDSDRVYLTTNQAIAKAYAIKYSNSPTPRCRDGALYEVTPIGEVHRDPDFPDASAGCWSAKRAVVVAVVHPTIEGPERAAVKIIGPYVRWKDNSPAYTDDGFMLPAPTLRELGATAADLRSLGRWVPIDAVSWRTDLRTPVLIREIG